MKSVKFTLFKPPFLKSALLKLTLLELLVLLTLNPQPALAECTLSSVSGINFGQYNSLDQQPNSGGIGTITLSCAGTTSGATVSLSTGSSNSYTNRTLTNGVDQLQYNVYATPGGGAVWGDGAGGSTTVVVPSNTRTSLTLYGVIPARQSIGAGVYSDTLLVMVNF